MEKRIFVRCKHGDKHEAELVTEEKVKIRDISIGGISLQTSQDLHTKNSLGVELTSSNNEKITTRCEVAWSSLIQTVEQKSESFSIYEVGLKFIELTDKEKGFLEKYIKELSK